MRKTAMLSTVVFAFTLLISQGCQRKNQDFKKEAPKISVMADSREERDVRKLIPVRDAEVEQPAQKKTGEKTPVKAEPAKEHTGSEYGELKGDSLKPIIKKEPEKTAPLVPTKTKYFERHEPKLLKPEIKKEQLIH